MRQKYQTSTGQTVHAIYAYNRLTVMNGPKEVMFYVPQYLRGEANCVIRRKDWPRMVSLLDALEIYTGPYLDADIGEPELADETDAVTIQAAA